MKTSILLFALIVINSFALVSEPLYALVSEIDPWLFITVEVGLLLSFYINYEFRGLKEIGNIDFSGIELFVVKSKDEAQGKP